MTLQTSTKLTEGFQLLNRKVASFGKRCINCRCRMPLGEDEAIACLIFGVFGVVFHHAAKIQRCKDISAGKRSAWMAAARFMQHLNDVRANGTGLFLSCQRIHGFLSVDYLALHYNEAFQRWYPTTNSSISPSRAASTLPLSILLRVSLISRYGYKT